MVYFLLLAAALLAPTPGWAGGQVQEEAAAVFMVLEALASAVTDPEKSEELFLKAQNILDEVSGEESPNALAAMDGRARGRYTRGAVPSAREALEDLIARRDRASGGRKAALARARGDAAWIARNVGDLVGARDLYASALGELDGEGAIDPALGVDLAAGLALCELGLGRREEARAALLGTRAEAAAGLPPESLARARWELASGSLALDDGDSAGAERRFRAAEEALSGHGDENRDDLNTAAVHRFLALVRLDRAAEGWAVVKPQVAGSLESRSMKFIFASYDLLEGMTALAHLPDGAVPADLEPGAVASALRDASVLSAYVSTMRTMAERAIIEGRWEQGVKDMGALLPLAEGCLGPRHPETGRILANLAHIAVASDRQADARALWERAIPVIEATHGRGGLALSEAQAGLAEVLQWHYDESAMARDLLRGCLPYFERKPGANRERLAELHLDLLHALVDTREWEEAVEESERALVAIRAAYPGGSWQATRVEFTAGVALAEAGNLAGGIPRMEAALRAFAADPKGSPGGHASEQETLARLLWRAGDLDRAIGVLESALELRRQAGQPEALVHCIDMLALARALKGDTEGGTALLAGDEVLAAGVRDPWVASHRLVGEAAVGAVAGQIEVAVARILLQKPASGEFQEDSWHVRLGTSVAAHLFEWGAAAQGLAIAQRLEASLQEGVDEDPMPLGHLYHQVGKLLRSADKGDEALEWFRKALAMREAAPSSDAEAVSGSLFRIAQTLRDLGRRDEARAYAERLATLRKHDEHPWGHDDEWALIHELTGDTGTTR